MKKALKNIVILGILSLIIYLLLNPILTEEEALKIGEEKYSEFLWMVDGAFNDERYNASFTVNGKEYPHNSFVCKYLSSDKNKCIGINFKENFKELFSEKIRYDIVYGDGVSFNWYNENNDIYTFNNANSCNQGRMGLDHLLVPILIERNKITYKVAFSTAMESGVRDVEKIFILKRENHSWKVSDAYYQDPCFMDYNIK